MAKVAVVSGGSRGIGAATAELMAARGWNICLGYQTDGEAAEQVARRCRATGQHAIAVAADLSREADVVHLFEAAETSLGIQGGDRR